MWISLFAHSNFIKVAFHCSAWDKFAYTIGIHYSSWFYQFALYSEEELPDIEVGMHGNSYSLL